VTGPVAFRSPPSPRAAGEKRQGTAALQDASRPSSAPGPRASVLDCASPLALSARGWRRAAEKPRVKEGGAPGATTIRRLAQLRRSGMLMEGNRHPIHLSVFRQRSAGGQECPRSVGQTSRSAGDRGLWPWARRLTWPNCPPSPFPTPTALRNPAQRCPAKGYVGPTGSLTTSRAVRQPPACAGHGRAAGGRRSSRRPEARQIPPHRLSGAYSPHIYGFRASTRSRRTTSSRSRESLKLTQSCPLAMGDRM